MPGAHECTLEGPEKRGTHATAIGVGKCQRKMKIAQRWIRAECAFERRKTRAQRAVSGDDRVHNCSVCGAVISPKLSRLALSQSHPGAGATSSPPASDRNGNPGADTVRKGPAAPRLQWHMLPTPWWRARWRWRSRFRGTPFRHRFRPARVVRSEPGKRTPHWLSLL